MRRPRRPKRSVRPLVVLLAIVAGALIAVGVPALASRGARSQHVPPRLAGRAKDAAQSRTANARSSSTGGPWWFISKATTVTTESTTIASLSLPAGSYQLTATGSVWVAGGNGAQEGGCHMLIGKSSYADAYFSLDSTAPQQSYALVNVLTFKAQTTVEVECVLAKPANDTISTQTNFVAIKA